MKVFSKIIIAAISILFLCLVTTGGLSLQKRDGQIGWQTILEDWTEESQEDDSSTEFEDDFDVSHSFSSSDNGSTLSFVSGFAFNNLKEPISEIIPPPPQA